MIRGVLFDMDGILLDSERLGRSIFQQACRERGYEVDDKRYEQLLGVTRANCSRLLKEQLGEAFPYDEVYEIYREGLRTHALDGTLPVKKGLQACMDGLKARGIRIALATSTPRQQVELYQQHIPAMKDAFDFMVCGGEAKSKPDPDIYLKAAEGLGLPISISSLGNLINVGRKLLSTGSSYQLLFPTIVLSIITISFYIVGNAFADAADPKNHL